MFLDLINYLINEEVMTKTRVSISMFKVLIIFGLWGRAVEAASSCIPSGDQNSINNALVHNGDVATLCPNSKFLLSAPVKFTAPNQSIITMGAPIDNSRAILRVNGAAQATAINAIGRSGIKIMNIIVDGSRPALGRLASGAALIEIGGYASGQVVRNVHAYEPRGWSTLHIFEGDVASKHVCSEAQILNNQIGPAGQPNKEWADGISLACTKSLVSNNIITDATDGGIVIFGAPGSTIQNNTVRSLSRVLLGGINMVDYSPYSGNFNGTVVSGNIIDSGLSGGFIKIGIAIGPEVWGGVAHAGPVVGGKVVNNILKGNNFAYGIAVNGAQNFTVQSNQLFNHPIFDGLMKSCPAGNHPPNEFTVNYANSTGIYTGFTSGKIESGVCTSPKFSFKVGEFKALTNKPIQLGDLMYVIMQSDANFVIYGAPGQALWSTKTRGATNCSSGQCRAVFQTDGNFVLYNGDIPFWASHTENQGGQQIKFSPTSPWLQITSAAGVAFQADTY